MKMVKKDRKREGAHDWDFPEFARYRYEDGEIRFETFSIGIFRWVPTKDGKGLKRGKAIMRLKGLTKDPEPVFRRAEALCDELDAGYVPEHKTESFVV